MPPLLEAFTSVRDFLELGGDVVLPILGVTFVMWLLIFERQWHFWFEHPEQVKRAMEAWRVRSDQTSWCAHRIRSLLVSRVKESLERFVGLIKTLVAVCPLLGLLGTVTGMIEVFDVMAITGSGNVRAMASGVYKAIIPTMAGMVAALSGLYFSARIERFAAQETERLEDRLTHA